jgi:hypothetical protein
MGRCLEVGRRKVGFMSTQVTQVNVVSTVMKDGSIKVVVPEPKAGPPEPEQRISPEGARYTVISFSKMTKEQLAWHVFWSDGTQHRINGIEDGSKNGAAGVKKNLRWLLGLRAREVLMKTGIVYDVEVREEAVLTAMADQCQRRVDEKREEKHWKTGKVIDVAVLGEGLAKAYEEGESMSEEPNWLYDRGVYGWIRPASDREKELFKKQGSKTINVTLRYKPPTETRAFTREHTEEHEREVIEKRNRGLDEKERRRKEEEFMIVGIEVPSRIRHVTTGGVEVNIDETGRIDVNFDEATRRVFTDIVVPPGGTVDVDGVVIKAPSKGKKAISSMVSKKRRPRAPR